MTGSSFADISLPSFFSQIADGKALSYYDVILNYF